MPNSVDALRTVSPKLDRPPRTQHFRARNHTKMSGVLRAAAPLARRLNAVPKGPVTQATRGMACAFPPVRAESLTAPLWDIFLPYPSHRTSSARGDRTHARPLVNARPSSDSSHLDES